MELTPESDSGPLVAFGPPRPAFDDGRYAMSPYLHYYQERRRPPGNPAPPNPHTAAEKTSHFERLLDRLIEDTLR